MKSASATRLCILAFGLSFLIISCNENTATPSTHSDSESVKIMGADSNSAMPVHTPKDSTEKMPNTYDSTKK